MCLTAGGAADCGDVDDDVVVVVVGRRRHAAFITLAILFLSRRVDLASC